MAAQTVHTEQHGRVLTVRLDNPPRNFMTAAMVAELRGARTAPARATARSARW